MENTETYGMTQEQMQALGNVIKGNVGKAKVLTTDDYNYPADNPTSVAAWLLPDGFYYVSGGVSVLQQRSTSYAIGPGDIFCKTSNENFVTYIMQSPNGNPQFSQVTVGGSNTGTNNRGLVTRIEDVLNSISSDRALSANQGRVLNDKISALSNYSTSEVDTGATWVDGGKIYKKTITFTVTANYQTIAHGIADFAALVKAEGVWLQSTGTYQPINRCAADHSDQVYNVGLGDVNTTTFGFSHGSGLADGGTGYVTLYYTKSS